MGSIAAEMREIRAALARLEKMGVPGKVERQTGTIAEAAAALSVSRAQVRRMLFSGALRSARIGRQRVVPLALLR